MGVWRGFGRTFGERVCGSRIFLTWVIARITSGQKQLSMLLLIIVACAIFIKCVS